MRIGVGDEARLLRTVSQADVSVFAEVTGDRNPVHLDSEFAAQSRFGRPIAHGMFCGGLISAVLGMQLPGPGAVYLQQTLKFRAPAYIGDTIETVVTVTALRADKPVVTMKTECWNQDGTLLVDGEAILLVPSPAE